MTVYVDDMYKYAIGQFRGMQMSHLIADMETELHTLAIRIGMERRWYQGDHYDVPLPKRRLAIEYGAIEITYRQASAMRRRQVIEATCGDPSEALEWYRQWRADLKRGA